MNLDFHYYATHLAARYAGFTKEEALIIAKAAQMVDEVAWGIPGAREKPDDSPSRTTCMTTGEMALMDATTSWSKEDIRALSEVWQCFHFLPGNEFYRYIYHGEESHTGWFSAPWKFTEGERNFFRQLCLPKSVAVWNMVEDLQNYRSRDNFLHMVGLRMHVLADTWSHQYFMGVPKWCFNEVDTVEIKQINSEGKASWTSANFTSTGSNNLETLTFQHTPTAYSYESISYLGHGRIGCIPDLGCLSYRWHPQWLPKGEFIYKDNVEIFNQAFHQMYYALKCIHDGTPFDPEYIPNDYSNEITRIVGTWILDQSVTWNWQINQSFGYQLPDFSKTDWFSEFESKTHGHYLRFIEAANDHVNFVKRMVSPTKFKHQQQDGDVTVESYLINHTDWQGENRATVCIDGKMYCRSVENFVPTGPLEQLAQVPYLEYNYHDQWSMSINQSTGMFRHTRNGEADRIGTLCNYCGWNDATKFAATIEDGASLGIYEDN